MELMIGEKLKKLRRNRDLTQEEVATHLGISYQAISKWERGDGYPDITMLPALANYFAVSVDELIGMEEITSASKLDEINQKWAENRSNGKHKENVELMRDALKIYPNNALLLVQLSTSLEKLDGTQTEKRKFLKESIMIQYCYCPASAGLFFVSRIKKIAIPNLFLPFDCVLKRNAPVDSPDFLDAGVTKLAEVFMFNVIRRRDYIEQH